MFNNSRKHIIERLDKIDATLQEVLKLSKEMNNFETVCNEHFDKIDKSLDDLKQRVYTLEKNK